LIVSKKKENKYYKYKNTSHELYSEIKVGENLKYIKSKKESIKCGTNKIEYENHFPFHCSV